jgi:predicted dehydrogenase
MRFLCGNVAQVHAYLKKSGDRQCWSNCQVGMRFRNGVIGNLTGSYDMCYQHPIERTELAGTKGRLVLENVYVDLWFYPHDSDEVTHIHNSIFGGVKDFNDTFTARIHRFMEQVANGDCPDAIEASGYDGLQAQEVIEAAIRSHQTGQAVDVPE